MNIKSIIIGTLFVSGFLISGCSETPQEKVRREVKEKCEAFVRSAAPPYREGRKSSKNNQ